MIVLRACAQHARIMQCLSLQRHWLACLLLFLCLSAIGNSAWGAVGTVLATSGQNRLEDASGSQQTISTGTKVNNGDTVYTGAAGHLQIRFVDGAIVSLRPNTDFRVDEYRYPAAPQRSFLSLLRGALRSATGLASKDEPGSYRLTTPSATIGVRGTHFVAQETVCAPDCAPDEQAGLHVSVSEGTIIVTNDTGSIELTEGQAARVAGPNAPPVKTASAPILSPRQYQQNQPPTPESINPLPQRLAQGNPDQPVLRLPDNYARDTTDSAKQAHERRSGSALASDREALEKAPALVSAPSADLTEPGNKTPDANSDMPTRENWTIPGPGRIRKSYAEAGAPKGRRGQSSLL